MKNVCMFIGISLIVWCSNFGCNATAGLGGTTDLVTGTSRDVNDDSSFSVNNYGDEEEVAADDNSVESGVDGDEASEDEVGGDTVADSDGSATQEEADAPQVSDGAEEAASSDDEDNDETDSDSSPLPPADWSTDWGEGRTYWS